MNYCLIKDANHNDPFTLKLIRECKLALTKTTFHIKKINLVFKKLYKDMLKMVFTMG